ncbi:MAG TPA: substrate-binding domain-containing protein [Dehalococcoidia bacterium]|nr:substrate-binding domain-containing protein [Dehalococcoidia bacterium]
MFGSIRWVGLWALLLVPAALLAACGGDDDGGGAGAVGSPAAQQTVIEEPDITPTLEPLPTRAGPAPTKTSGNIILSTTTSTQDSGLLDELVPLFEEETGYSVQVIAVGSGQAIEMGMRGDADVVLVHSPVAEREFVASGNGIGRALVMHNDFILVGPESDPAGALAQETLDDVLRAIAQTGAPFVSRGDDSGTHALERSLWEGVAIDPTGESWYEETGQGMGATLQVASQRRAYTITDRATYLAQRDNLDLEILYQGEQKLLNYYHVILVNPDVHDVNALGARAFAEFLVRPDIQARIGQFGVEEYGEPLFFPDAGKPDPTE